MFGLCGWQDHIEWKFDLDLNALSNNMVFLMGKIQATKSVSGEDNPTIKDAIKLLQDVVDGSDMEDRGNFFKSENLKKIKYYHFLGNNWSTIQASWLNKFNYSPNFQVLTNELKSDLELLLNQPDLQDVEFWTELKFAKIRQFFHIVRGIILYKWYEKQERGLCFA